MKRDLAYLCNSDLLPVYMQNVSVVNWLRGIVGTQTIFLKSKRHGHKQTDTHRKEPSFYYIVQMDVCME